MIGRWLREGRLSAVVAFAILVVVVPTPRAGAAVHAYGVPTLSRVEKSETGAVQASPVLLTDPREESASPAAQTVPSSTTPARSFIATEAGSGAESAVAGRNLGRQLASEEQVGEAGTAMAGAGTSTELRVASRLADQYGGSASDWAKVGGSVSVLFSGLTAYSLGLEASLLGTL